MVTEVPYIYAFMIIIKQKTIFLIHYIQQTTRQFKLFLNCMENTLINKNNNKIYKIMISRYFQMWRSIFYKYNSNDISNEIDKWLKDLTDPRIKYETFSYPIIFGNIQIYSCFDIEYIKKITSKIS